MCTKWWIPNAIALSNLTNYYETLTLVLWFPHSGNTCELNQPQMIQILVKPVIEIEHRKKQEAVSCCYHMRMNL